MFALTPPDTRATTAAAAPHAAVRTVFVHHHLFKNAGTSLDHWLRTGFGTAWAAHEGPGHLWPADEVWSWLRAHPHVELLSSHTALMSPRPPADLQVVPLVLLRHPLDRARSVYEFERRQAADTEGARQAKQLSMGAYIAWRLERPGDRSLRDFQAHRLQYGGTGATEAARAGDALARLPFVGLVEDFAGSLRRLRDLLPAGRRPAADASHLNRTEGGSVPLRERLARLEAEIGPELFQRLRAANREDLRLHAALRQRLRGTPPDAQAHARAA